MCANELKKLKSGAHKNWNLQKRIAHRAKSKFSRGYCDKGSFHTGDGVGIVPPP